MWNGLGCSGWLTLISWQVPFLCNFIPRQQKALAAVQLIRDTTEELIRRCREIVEAEGESQFDSDYMDDSDPSVLRFLMASREEVSSSQLRDDLLSMLVAGHETTGSALTWTLYLLSKNPDKKRKAQVGHKATASNVRRQLPSDAQAELNILGPGSRSYPCLLHSPHDQFIALRGYRY